MKKSLAVAVLALVAFSGVAQAQTAQIQATATVATVLTVNAGAPLDFGTVFPGFSRTINPLTSTSAGSFTLGGQAGAQVSLSFSTLPVTLTGPGAPLVVTYGATAASYGTTNVQAAATPFDPAVAGHLVNLSAGGAGNGYLWIGGTVNPPAGQTSGTYTASIVLAAAYTGN